MKTILMAATVAATFAVLPAYAASDADCQTMWTKADVYMTRKIDDGAPLKGANSFTEGQAKDRAVASGLTSVADLKKDGDGIWRGSAMQDGKTVQIAVDFKGNVVPQTAP